MQSEGSLSARGSKRRAVDPLEELEQLNFELFKKVGLLEAQLQEKAGLPEH